MKRIIFKTAAIVLILTGVIACKKERENEPIEIPFTEYSFGERSCQWTNLNKDEKVKVIAINNDAEMDEYVTCEEGDYYPDIDFSKNTLLIASGKVAGGIGHLSKRLLFKENKYVLEIEILLNNTTISGEPWYISILVSTVPYNTVIDLEVNTLIIKS
jgi:hypothetical protein